MYRIIPCWGNIWDSWLIGGPLIFYLPIYVLLETASLVQRLSQLWPDPPRRISPDTGRPKSTDPLWGCPLTRPGDGCSRMSRVGARLHICSLRRWAVRSHET